MAQYIFLLDNNQSTHDRVVHGVCTGVDRLQGHRGMVYVLGASCIGSGVRAALRCPIPDERLRNVGDDYALEKLISARSMSDIGLVLDTAKGDAVMAHHDWQVWRQIYERPALWIHMLHCLVEQGAVPVEKRKPLYRCVWSYFFGGGLGHSLACLTGSDAYARFMYGNPEEMWQGDFTWSRFDSGNWLGKHRRLVEEKELYSLLQNRKALERLLRRLSEGRGIRYNHPVFGEISGSSPAAAVSLEEWVELFGLRPERRQPTEDALDAWG